MEIATLAAGCFWCTEAIFKRLKGVQKVMAGYAGGSMENPTDRDVYTGTTGHAEAIQIEFDPRLISYDTVLKIFFAFHDPTTLNRQGADVGTQYRSVIFYHSDEQKKIAEKVKKDSEASDVYKSSIVTEIVAYTKFYPAQEHHQDFFAKNPSSPYCLLVIDPKIQKLLEGYKEYLKNA